MIIYVPSMASLWNMTPAEYWLAQAARHDKEAAQGGEYAEQWQVEAAWCRVRAASEGGPPVDKATRKLAAQRAS